MKINYFSSDEQPKLMIIPMIDIIFFLLVFFMMSMLSMVEQRSIPVALPAAAVQANTAKTIPVTVTKEGNIYLEQEPLRLIELEKRLALAKREAADISVVLRGDEEVAYGRMIGVMNAVKKAGVSKVAVATDSR